MNLKGGEDSGALWIIGVGLDPVLHLTLQGNYCLREADIICFIDWDGSFLGLMEETGWGDKCRSLMKFYDEGAARADCYQRMAKEVKAATQQAKKVALAVPGNPLFFDSFSRMVASACSAAGVRCVVLPGVSSFDLMIHDLGLEVGQHGVQIYDASWFVENLPKVDTSVPLFLFQPEVAFCASVRRSETPPEHELLALQEVLERLYSPKDRWYVVHSISNLGSNRIVSGALEELRRCGSSIGGGTLFFPGLRFENELRMESKNKDFR